MKKCEFFVHEQVILQIKVIAGPVKSSDPIVHDIKKCTHPGYLKKPDLLSVNVTCEGNISNCVIPFEWNRHSERTIFRGI